MRGLDVPVSKDFGVLFIKSRDLSLDCLIRDDLDTSLVVGKSHPELEAGILPFYTAFSLQALCRAPLGEGAAEGQGPLLLALGLLPGMGQDTKNIH